MVSKAEYLVFIIYICFFGFAVAYLSGFFDSYKKTDLAFHETDLLSLIEHLTRHKSRTKNYKRSPVHYQSFNRSIRANKQGEHVHFQYEFPLFGHHHHTLSYTLEPMQVSADVDAFGIEMRAIRKISDTQIGPNTNLPETELSALMNHGGWYFRSKEDWGLDFVALVGAYRRFTAPIAHSIYESLQSKGGDTYFNRVQAALNFVQFIPYGIPDFDTDEWYYHELAVPPESFILGYADCDSKSIFLAAMLTELIPWENFVLVQCLVKSNNEKTNGGHMMVAVSDLEIEGEMVPYAEKQYLLLETTTPWVIGKTDWESIELIKIVRLT